MTKQEQTQTTSLNEEGKRRDRAAGESHGLEASTGGALSNRELLLSRRHFLYGAVGVGVLATSFGGSAFTGTAFASDEDIAYVEVPEDAVFNQEDCTIGATSDFMILVGAFELPYGTLVWTNGDAIAACLLPTETSKPLTQAGVLFLGNGHYTVLLEAAIGAAQGFDIYDVRANDQGIVWTEANVFSNVWHIYTATFNGEAIGEAVKVDEGGSDWETPTIAAVGAYAFWQVLPSLSGTKLTESSVLKRASFGKAEADTVYASEGRMSTPPYPLRDSLVITPRTKTDTVHHQLTLLDAKTGEAQDTLVLPQAMKPLEAGWGNTGFTFSFDGGYNHGGGIANQGTYTPQSTKAPGDYLGRTWFHFTRSPTAPPCWCRDWFMVKSIRAVCGVNLKDKVYFVIDIENGSDTYGDYLASTGMNGSVVTYANINSKSIEGTTRKCCLVRVWAPLPDVSAATEQPPSV